MTHRSVNLMQFFSLLSLNLFSLQLDDTQTVFFYSMKNIHFFAVKPRVSRQTPVHVHYCSILTIRCLRVILRFVFVFFLIPLLKYLEHYATTTSTNTKKKKKLKFIWECGFKQLKNFFKFFSLRSMHCFETRINSCFCLAGASD